jgi:Zn-dependent M28 family amino/carboxypeptidase
MEIERNVRRHVQALAGAIAERNHARPQAYRQADIYVAEAFGRAGYSPRSLQERRVDGVKVHNIEAELLGTNRPAEILVIGAHYDSEEECPGADDNASGVAAMLELARLCAGHPLGRTVRFVAFYDEEDFGERPMGSRLYAADARRRQENIVGMICLETIGYYSDVPKGQHYPLLFRVFYPGYPTAPNFISFIGNRASRDLVRQAVASFRARARLPSEAFIAPWFVSDAGRSDHASFWKEGFPGLMVTDTANFRYRYYHRPEDTPDQLDYDRTARLVEGLLEVIRDLANQRSG